MYMNPSLNLPARLKHENSPVFDFEQSPTTNTIGTGVQVPPTANGYTGSQWPCRMEVAETPEKSRVETQIPIDLKLHNIPHGITKIHLPAHTISKPKFQSRPPHEKTPDTAELSAMLVCASAMEKDGLLDRALDRAARHDIWVPKYENQQAATKVEIDDADPDAPLNGGPVTICAGCILRERKRAARKKSTKIEEEKEWAAEENKRVIVFNCAEVRDWTVEGTKDEAMKDHSGPAPVVYVKAPMRIACYCRHRNEKVGFQ